MENENKKLGLQKGGLIWTIWNLVEATLLMAMGVLTIINCNNEGLHRSLFIIIAVFLIVGGALRLIANFLPVFVAKTVDNENKLFIRMNMSYDMSVAGSIEMALGIALLVAMNGDSATVGAIIQSITNIIVYFASILLIVGGASLILFAIGFIITKLYKLYFPIIEIIFGAAAITLGIVILVAYGNDGKQTIITVLLVIIGAFLVLIGVGEAILTVKPLIKNKSKAKDKKDDKVIEAETKEAQPKSEEKEEEVPAIETKETKEIPAKKKPAEPVEIEAKEKKTKAK